MSVDFRHQLGQLLGKILVQWSAITLAAGFALYVAGYLAIRFRLTALGLGADLDLIDERYMFEGARFLIYLAAALPVAIAILAIVVGGAWAIGRAVPSLGGWLGRSLRDGAWPMVVAIIVAVVLVQALMRQCFLFDNLLLRESLPEPHWFAAMLLEPAGVKMSLFVGALLAGLFLTMLPFAGLPAWSELSPRRRAIASVLFVLVALETLLLPVNFGVLTTARSLPRMGRTNQANLDERATAAWLVWEGQRTLTFFVVGPEGPSLVSVKPELERLEIVGYDGLAAVRRDAAAASASRGVDPGSIVSPTPTRDATPRDPAVRLWAKRLARIAGLAATPVMQRDGDLAAAIAGDLHLVAVAGGTPQRLTRSGDLRSPIFVSHDRELLALRGDEIVRIRLAERNATPRPVASLRGVQRLIGLDPDATDTVICLGGPHGSKTLYAISLDSGEATVIDTLSEAAEIACVLGDAREYGATRLLVAQRSNPVSKWTDVLIQDGDAPPRTLASGEGGGSARQPALSGDGKFVVFTRLPGS